MLLQAETGNEKLASVKRLLNLLAGDSSDCLNFILLKYFAEDFQIIRGNLPQSRFCSAMTMAMCIWRTLDVLFFLSLLLLPNVVLQKWRVTNHHLAKLFLLSKYICNSLTQKISFRHFNSGNLLSIVIIIILHCGVVTHLAVDFVSSIGVIDVDFGCPPQLLHLLVLDQTDYKEE